MEFFALWVGGGTRKQIILNPGGYTSYGGYPPQRQRGYNVLSFFLAVEACSDLGYSFTIFSRSNLALPLSLS